MRAPEGYPARSAKTPPVRDDGTVTWFVAVHASAAAIALVLGAVNLVRRPKGDRTHRIVGACWVAAMYWVIVSSFAIKDLRPGHFSWIHGLSVFTFGTLSIGLWAALTGRPEHHRTFMTGSYFGLVGAFIGAVAVPSRQVPQLSVHHPGQFVAGIAVDLAVALFILWLAGVRGLPRRRAPVAADVPLHRTPHAG